MATAEASPEAGAPALQVRKVTGDVVLSLAREELAEVTCLKLRMRCAEALEKRFLEVLLVHETRQLEDEEGLEELLPAEGALELMLVMNALPKFDPNQPAMEQLEALKWMLTDAEADEQLVACREFRRLLSLERAPPIEQFVEMGLVPRMIELCQVESPALQFEAAWALTNVASGTHQQTQAIVESGGVEVFVRLLAMDNGQVDHGDIREQAVWALGNIAGDSAGLRDVVLAAGALAPIAELCTRMEGLTFKRNSVWAISNFCRGKPAPPLESMQPAVPALVQAVRSEDPEIRMDAAWAFSYIADGDSERIQAVLDAGVLPDLLELLRHAAPSVQTPALRTVGNILTGEAHQTELVIQHGGLALLGALLTHEKRGIRKECCWAISNITAGTQEQVQAVLDAGLLPQVLRLMEPGEAADIRREAVWVVCNATDNGSLPQIKRLVEEGCIGPLVTVLGGRERRTSRLVLSGIKKILEAGESETGKNPFVQLLLEEGLAETADQMKDTLVDDEEALGEIDEVLEMLKCEPEEES